MHRLIITVLALQFQNRFSVWNSGAILAMKRVRPMIHSGGGGGGKRNCVRALVHL
jgi:hypothetical protein